MIITIDRYSFDKKFISTGLLTVTDKDHSTHLSYSDKEIEATASGLYHPLTALEKLRIKSERKYQSLIACNGCRNDVDYRASGSYNCYIIIHQTPATTLVNRFEPTDQIGKLCTVEEHEIAYKQWLRSLGFFV